MELGGLSKAHGTNNSLEIIEQIRDAQTHRRKLSHSHQSQCLCLEFADKILIFAILKRWLLQQRETDFSFFVIAFIHQQVVVEHN